MEESPKEKYLKAQKYRNEGMLQCTGWSRLGCIFPENSGGDSETVYISEVCNFIFNEPRLSYCNGEVFMGVIFISIDGSRTITCASWSAESRSVNITEDNIENIFWKAIDLPNLYGLEN